MSHNRYFLIIASLFLGTSLFLLARGGYVSADEWDYSEWNYFDSVDYSAPPQTYTDWGDAYYPLETIQDPFNIFQTQYSQSPTDYGLWAGGTAYNPLPDAESGSPDFSQREFFSPAQSESVAQPEAPPENNLFKRILGNWNLTEQPPAPPETPVVLASNDSAILQLPPNWGVPETRTDVYTGIFQNSGGQTTSNITDVDLGGGARSQAGNQSSLNTVSGRYTNPSIYSDPGPQLYTAEAGFSPKGLVMNAINYVKDFVTAGSATNVNVTGVGPKRVEVDFGGVSYTARAIPSGAYVQAEWKIDSFFRLVKPK